MSAATTHAARGISPVASSGVFIGRSLVHSMRDGEGLLMAIIGGRTSIQGPLIGALLLSIFGELFRTVFSSANLLIYGVLILAVTIYAPNGLMGLFRRGGLKLGVNR